MDIFNKFSDSLKKVIVEAEKMAAQENTALDTGHELISLLLEKNTLAFEILDHASVSTDKLKLIISLLNHRAPESTVSEDAKKSLQIAAQSALKYHHGLIGPEHLLLALISDKSFKSYLALERLGANPIKIREQIETIFAGINDSIKKEPPIQFGGFMSMPPDNMPFDDNFGEGMPFGPEMPFTQTATAQGKKGNFLDNYSTNLTSRAKKNELDPVIGRDKEISRLIQTLCRRTKNNPVLVGEPGVGKTAIVEGLAQRIVKGKIPANLSGFEIIMLDLGSVLAGTMYRGQFESRIKKILAEIEKQKNIILFVDEIHMMVGAGSTEGSIDAANLLKPMLARGALRLIGSTTFDEYKKHIEKDAAFERRFQPIVVSEPTIEETYKILSGIKERYEKFHKVKYADEALRAAAELAERYIHDRFLPDKAIDLIDEAGASINIKYSSDDKSGELRHRLAKLVKQKESYIMAENYEAAARVREDEAKIELTLMKSSTNNLDKSKRVVSAQEIADFVAELTGVPIQNLTYAEKASLLNLEKRLGKFIIGQDEALKEVSKALKRARVGIGNPKRPIGSFIFLGPTGVGKTELARVLAREIFGSDQALIKIDMSEFLEKHNVSRLIGAPAGYVGYDEGGKLTEAVRRQPYSVILFDEIEKAHPDVFNILLQIMEDGVLSDAKGREVNFKNTIIIMTSNLGTDIITHRKGIGFNKSDNSIEEYEAMKNIIVENAKKHFRPEFLNRLDKIVVFYPLLKKSLLKIIDLSLDELISRLASKKIELTITPEVKEFIVNESYNPEFGARPLRQYIADNLETLISETLLSKKFANATKIELVLVSGKIEIK